VISGNSLQCLLLDQILIKDKTNNIRLFLAIFQVINGVDKLKRELNGCKKIYNWWKCRFAIFWCLS